MAKVSLSLSGDEIGSIDVGFEISGADAMRILKWSIDMFDTGEDEDGNPAPPNPAKAIAAVAAMTLRGILQKVEDYERQIAAQAAVAAIAPIAATVAGSDVPAVQK